MNENCEHDIGYFKDDYSRPLLVEGNISKAKYLYVVGLVEPPKKEFIRNTFCPKCGEELDFSWLDKENSLKEMETELITISRFLDDVKVERLRLAGNVSCFRKTLDEVTLMAFNNIIVSKGMDF